jgi:hypothetical protein
MPGYLPERVILRAEIDGKGQAGLGGNILVGGLLGAAIDGASGAMYSHGENPLVIELRPATSGDDSAAAVD